jgi:hypothetical protein
LVLVATCQHSPQNNSRCYIKPCVLNTDHRTISIRIWLVWTAKELLFDSRQEQEDFPLVLSVQKDPGIYPASCSVGKVAVSWGVKRAGSKTEHSSPTSDEVKNVWSCNFTPTYAFMFSTGENQGVLTFKSFENFFCWSRFISKTFLR